MTTNTITSQSPVSTAIQNQLPPTANTTAAGRSIRPAPMDYLGTSTTTRNFSNIPKPPSKSPANNGSRFTAAVDPAATEVTKLTESFFEGATNTTNITLDQTRALTDQFFDNNKNLTKQQQAEVLLSLLENDPNKANDNWSQTNSFKNDAQRHLMSKAFSSIQDASFPTAEKVNYLNQLESLSDNNLNKRKIGTNEQTGDLNTAIKGAIQKAEEDASKASTLTPGVGAPPKRPRLKDVVSHPRVSLSRSSTASTPANSDSPSTKKSSSAAQPSSDTLLQEQPDKFKQAASLHRSRSVTQPVSIDNASTEKSSSAAQPSSDTLLPEPPDKVVESAPKKDPDAATVASKSSLAVQKTSTLDLHSSGPLPSIPTLIPVRPRAEEKQTPLDATPTIQLNKTPGKVDTPADSSNSNNSDFRMPPVPNEGPTNIRTSRAESDFSMPAVPQEHTTAETVKNWFEEYPDTVALTFGTNKNTAATAIKDIFKQDPENALKETAQQVGRRYRTNNSQTGVPSYKQTDDQIDFIRQNLSPEQLKSFDQAVLKALKEDKQLTAHYYRQNINNARDASVKAPAFEEGWGDDLTLGKMLETVEKSVKGTPLDNFLRQVKDVKNLEGAEQKKLLQQGKDILAGLDKSKLSPQQLKYVTQMQKNISTLENSLSLAEKGKFNNKTTTKVFAALAACIAGMAGLIGLLVHINRDITVEGEGEPEDTREQIADKENTLKENQEKLAALQTEIDDLKKLNDPADALADSQKALTEKQAQADKLQEQVNQLRGEVGNKTEEQIREEAVKKSEAEAWQDKDSTVTRIDDVTGGRTVVLTEAAKTEAQAAGERAVNEWKEKQATLAEAETALNGEKNSLKDLQANHQGLVNQHNDYQRAQSELKSKGSEQHQLHAENNRIVDDIEKLKNTSPSTVSVTRNTGDLPVNMLTGGLLAVVSGFTGFAAFKSFKRATPLYHMRRATRATQQVTGRGEKLLGTLADTHTGGGTQAPNPTAAPAG